MKFLLFVFNVCVLFWPAAAFSQINQFTVTVTNVADHNEGSVRAFVFFGVDADVDDDPIMWMESDISEVNRSEATFVFPDSGSDIVAPEGSNFIMVAAMQFRDGQPYRASFVRIVPIDDAMRNGHDEVVVELQPSFAGAVAGTFPLQPGVDPNFFESRPEVPINVLGFMFDRNFVFDARAMTALEGFLTSNSASLIGMAWSDRKSVFRYLYGRFDGATAGDGANEQREAAERMLLSFGVEISSQAARAAQPDSGYDFVPRMDQGLHDRVAQILYKSGSNYIDLSTVLVKNLGVERDYVNCMYFSERALSSIERSLVSAERPDQTRLNDIFKLMVLGQNCLLRDVGESSLALFPITPDKEADFGRLFLDTPAREALTNVILNLADILRLRDPEWDATTAIVHVRKTRNFLEPIDLFLQLSN